MLVCVSFLFACFFSDRQLREAWDGDRNLERKIFSFFPLFNMLSVGLVFVIFLSGTSRTERQGGTE